MLKFKKKLAIPFIYILQKVILETGCFVSLK